MNDLTAHEATGIWRPPAGCGLTAPAVLAATLVLLLAPVALCDGRRALAGMLDLAVAGNTGIFVVSPGVCKDEVMMQAAVGCNKRVP